MNSLPWILLFWSLVRLFASWCRHSWQSLANHRNSCIIHATERYSPLTSMCNAKTANVSIIPHIWEKDSCNISSTWYCPYCIQTILPFNHFDKDKDFFGAVMEQRLNCSFRFHEMNSRVFVPFEINQDSNTQFTEIGPDLQFYTESNDTNLFISGHDIETLCNKINEDLEKIQEWLCANKLYLNVTKTDCMVFTSRNKSVSDIDIRINNVSIERVYVTKFLGKRIDSQLNWKHHTEYTCKKLSKCIGILSKAKKNCINPLWSHCIILLLILTRFIVIRFGEIIILQL